jgi:predicted metal-dependent hydrolase
VPGSGSTPDMVPLEQAKSLALPETRAADWQDNAAYLYGHRLLKAGFYWEAHEVWEAVWMNCRPNSTEKVLLKALIQQANARLKRNMGKENAASRLESMVEGLRQEVCARLDGRSDLMGVSVTTKFMHFNA